LWKHFECKKCGRCCRCIGLPFDAGKLGGIANFLGITEEEVVERYYGKIVVEKGNRKIHFQDEKRTPCPFLNTDNNCSIYEVRPHGCRMYPVETDGGRQGVDCPGLVIPE